MIDIFLTTEVGLKESALLRSKRIVLERLLLDQTTGENIKWGTDNYSRTGQAFYEHQPIKVDLITGWYDGMIQPRADKDTQTQLTRTRNKAEVFTPSWVIDKQVTAAMESYMNLSLEEFLKTKWLEITCGEGPYLANRYDMIDGKLIDLDHRVGFIDRKFQRLNQEVKEKATWLSHALTIYQSSYGYEYQGDSLLLARENLLLTFIDNYFFMFGGVPSDDLLLAITQVISKNVFQMDGLTYQVPYSGHPFVEIEQLSLFDELEEIDEQVDLFKPELAQIKFWDLDKTVDFIELTERGSEMKFDVVIGNPPYQESSEVSNRQEPIYQHFYESAEKIADIYCLITPARFLFNAGLTPKKWNEKMLGDKHLDVLFYESNSSKVFPTTEIKAGVAVVYRDINKENQPIKKFIPNQKLSSIASKFEEKQNINLTSIMYGGRSDLVFNEEFLKAYPNSKTERLKYIQKTRPKVKVLGKNEEFELKTSTFSALEHVFTNEEPENYKDYYKLLGLINTKRVWKWIERKYMNPRREDHNIDDFKVFITEANGSGNFGEVLSEPVLGKRGDSSTSTFISIGKFDTEIEAFNCIRYVKSKFLRCLLGILKITQHTPPSNWAYIPLQDFTPDSDIDWTESISNIDKQLYKKYNLSQEEIDFIEENVKEME